MRWIIKAVITFGIVFSIQCSKTPPSIQWKVVFYGSEYANGHSAQQTEDKGFIAAGYTSTSQSSERDFYIIKTDSLGNTQWEKIIDRGNEDEAFWVKQSNDGGYALLGTKDGWPYGAYFIKTDRFGEILWEKELFRGDTLGDTTVYGFGLEYTKDSCYVIVLQTTWAGDNLPKLYLLKMDSLGNRQWGKILCETKYELPQSISIQQTKDGGFIIGSYAFTKTDSLGNFQWTKIFNRYEVGIGPEVRQTRDGGYAATGMGIFKGIFGLGHRDDIYLMKTDSIGNFKWRKTFGGNGQDVGFSLKQTSDNGYIIAGLTYSFGVNSDCYIIRADSLGNLRWTKTLGLPYSEAEYIQQTSDEGYIITGTMFDSQAKKSGIYLLKLASESK
jgi:hypothetical protein